MTRTMNFMSTKVVGWGPWKLLGESGRVQRAAKSAERLMELADPRVQSQLPTTDPSDAVGGIVEASTPSVRVALATDSGGTAEVPVAKKPGDGEVATGSRQRSPVAPGRREDAITTVERPVEDFKHVREPSVVASGGDSPVGDPDLSEVFDVLRAAPVEQQMNWSRRYKANLEKLHSGDPRKVAEVVRDLWHRERDSGLSAGEKKMLDKARQVLVSELALAQRTDELQAEATLDRVLAIVG